MTISLLSMHPSRAWLSAFAFFLGVSAAAAPEDKPDAAPSNAQLRAYLPVIRHKALLDNEREYVADIEKCLELYELLRESGIVTAVTKNRIEEEVERGRIRVLSYKRDYRDAMDQYTQRFHFSAARRRQMKDAAISPLTEQFRRYEILARDCDEIQRKVLEQARVEDGPKLRSILVKLLTTSALVKDTDLPARFRKDWKEWEKIDSMKGMQNRIGELLNERSRVRSREMQLKGEGKELPPADLERGKKNHLAYCVGNLELQMRIYDRQPWKDLQKKIEEVSLKNETFNGIVRSALAISDLAAMERLAKLSEAWTELATTRLKGVDLISCDTDTAEQTVTALRKTPDTQLAARKKVRQLRTLAESYEIQQRLFELTYLRREYLKDSRNWTKPSTDTQPGLVGPVAKPPTTDESILEAPRVIDAHRSLSRVKRQMLQSWIDYQMVRLDLYSDLAMSPP